MVVHAIALASSIALPLQAVAPGQAKAPACETSQDSEYAYTVEKPVQVGGSPMYGAARQRRYLDALRGPEGQPVKYRRLGQFRAPDGTILDGYEVTHEGLDKPVTLYLDWYHYNPQKLPLGFTCGGPVALPPPPVNPFQESDDLRRLAVEQGAAREFEPIPLGSNGSAHGVIFDHFRLLARASRAAATGGDRLDPEKIPRELASIGMVIIAYAQRCGEKTIPATAIDVVAQNGSAMPKDGQLSASGAEIARLVTGFDAPPNSFAVTAPLRTPRLNDTIRITYAEACGTTSDQVSLAVTGTPAKPLDFPAPPLPEGAPPNQPVLLQVLIDPDGALRTPSYVGGPPELLAAAVEAIKRWRAEPARINGAAVPHATLVAVNFR